MKGKIPVPPYAYDIKEETRQLQSLSIIRVCVCVRVSYVKIMMKDGDRGKIKVST